MRVAQSIRAGHVTVEVQHLLGGGIFRSVAMQGTQGLRRGDPAELLPGPISVPCRWQGTSSRRTRQPYGMLPTVKRRSIHRSDGHQGCRWMCSLPYKRGGKIGLFGGAYQQHRKGWRESGSTSALILSLYRRHIECFLRHRWIYRTRHGCRRQGYRVEYRGWSRWLELQVQ